MIIASGDMMHSTLKLSKHYIHIDNFHFKISLVSQKYASQERT